MRSFGHIQSSTIETCSPFWARPVEEAMESQVLPGRRVADVKMGVSKNRGKPPKWMVKIMEKPIFQWMIWGYPLFLETPKYS